MDIVLAKRANICYNTYVYGSVCRTEPYSRGISGALYLKSAVAGVIFSLRVAFVQSASRFSVLKGGSRAIGGREPCQVGDQAALSGLTDVPRGCLPGAGYGVTVRKRGFEGRKYGSFRYIEHMLLRERGRAVPRALFCIEGDLCTRRCTESGALRILTMCADRRRSPIFSNTR